MLSPTMASTWGSAPLHIQWKKPKRPGVILNDLPSFLPKEVYNIKDQSARNLASRIQRLPVSSHLENLVPFRRLLVVLTII